MNSENKEMAKAEKILKAVNLCKCKFQETRRELVEYLKPVFDEESPPKRQKLQQYKAFVFRFLHAVVSQKKPPTDVGQVQQMLQSCVLCCDVAVFLQDKTENDGQCGVAKLIYHILLKHTGQEPHLDEIFKLSAQLYEMILFAGRNIPENASKVLQAAYAVLWNSAVKIVPKDFTDGGKLQEQILKQLAVCLKLLSLLPDHSLLLDRLQDFTANSAQWIINSTREISLQNEMEISRAEVRYKQHGFLVTVFEAVIERLVGLCDADVEGNELQSLEHQRTLSQVRCMVCEWLIKMRLYDNATQIALDLQETTSEELKPVCEAVARMFNVIIQTDKTICLDSGDRLEEISENLSAAHAMMDVVKVDNVTVLWLAHRSHNLFMQQINKKYFEHFKSQFTTQNVQILTKTSDIFVTLCSKTIEQTQKQIKTTKDNIGNKVDQDTDKRKKLDYVAKLYGWRLGAYFKQLELFCQLLQQNLEGGHNEFLDKVVETASTYENVLIEDSGTISTKNLQTERYNIGYICSLLGKLLYTNQQYKHAGLLLKISGHHVHLCGSPKAVRLYELSVDCYRNVQSWLEASKVMMDMIAIGAEAILPAVGIWSRVRKDAIVSGEQLFTEMTFSNIVEKSGVKLTEYSTRDLLILEYHVWRKFSKRELEIEYYLLTEMLDRSTNQVQRAEVMIELAGNMFLTGKTYKESSPGEFLNKAIIILDKSKENVQSYLAIANYRKYVISHEETLENRCSLNEEKTEDDTEETNETNQQTSVQSDKKTFKYDTPCTLATEQRHLPFLIQALEIWETTLKNDLTDEQRGEDNQRKGESLLNQEFNLDTIISCGTRLLAMKQFSYAYRTLQIACQQLNNINNNKQILRLRIRTAQALILLGKFDKAEQMIDTIETEGEALEKMLLKAELLLLIGKKEEGIAIVQKILGTRRSMTHKTCLINGTAKRLLSMFLCFPDGHKISPVSDDILSLASEAVKQHITVLKLEIKNENDSKSQDKWILIFEFLQSLQHMCQLYRYTGLPRMAECYLREGIKLSQAEGLPRWSCEFMFEALRIESMQVNGVKSIAAVDAIKRILEASHIAKSGEIQKQPIEAVKCSGSKLNSDQSENHENDKVTSASETDKPANSIFSLENELPQKLDTSQREQMSKLVVPECTCIQEKNSDHCDVHIHRLYIKAGIVLSDFLSQYEMEADAGRILCDLQMKYPQSLKLGTLNNTTALHKQAIIGLDSKSVTDFLDPQVKFLCLEAMCLQAESLLYQKKFSEVQQLWTSMKTLEKEGFWNNVIHSEILMTRVALCQATSFMFAVQPNTLKLSDKRILEETTELCSLADLPNILSNKKVTFVDSASHKAKDLDNHITEIDQENICPYDNPVIPQKNSLMSSKSGPLTPMKSKSFLENQETSDKLMEKLILSAKKQKLNQVLGTPLTGRQNKLDFLMESDHEDDIVFPAQKPVTPKSIKSKKVRKVRSRKGSQSVTKTSLTDSEHDSSMVSVTPVCKLKLDTSNTIEPAVTCTVEEECNKSSNETRLNCKRTRKKIVSGETRHNLEINSLIEENSSTEDRGNGRILNVNKAVKCQADVTFDRSLENVDTDKSKDGIVFPAPKMVTPARITNGKGQNVRLRTRKLIKCNLDADGDKYGNNGSEMVSHDGTKNIEDCHAQNNTEQLDMEAETVSDALKVQGKSITEDTVNGTRRKRKQSVETCEKNSKVKTSISKKENKAKVVGSAVLELKGDIYDLESSPFEKSKSKTRGKSKCTKITKKYGKIDNDVITPQDKSIKPTTELECKKISSKKNTTVTRNRRNLRSAIETTRTFNQNTNSEGLQDKFEQLDASIELCIDKNSFDLSYSEFLDFEDEGLESPKLFHEPESKLDQVALPNSILPHSVNEFEPIEIMRGGVKRKERGKQNSTKPSTNLSIEGVNCKLLDPSEMEVVRSSGSVSVKSLMDRISLDCSADVVSETEGSSNDIQAAEGEEKMIEFLEELCGRISHFAPYPQYPQMCQVLAVKYVRTNPRRAAHLLSESIAVSFRHHAAVIRGKNKSSTNKDKSTRMSRDAAMSENMHGNKDDLFFVKDESGLQTMIDVIPIDWCVVQVSVINDLLKCQHFILTRFVRGKTPVVVEIPAFSTPQGRYVLRDFQKVLLRNKSLSELDKVDWWRQRLKLNSDLQGVIENMERFWIGLWKCVFLPPINDENVLGALKKDIQKVLKVDVDDSKLEMLLLSLSTMSESQFSSVVKVLLGDQCKDAQVESVISVVKKCSLPYSPITSQHHVVLILDKNVQHLPWECLPVLSERSVSRMPCLSHLYYQLSYLCMQESSLYNKGVNPRSTFYIVNPDSDLSHTEEQFKDWFNSEAGWKGICGTKPTKEQFVEAITERDLLIYLGHGSGGRYFPGGEIEKLQAHAVTILMGCSSGKLLVKGQLEPYGIMTSYFLAGCPCMVANLWDVTDKDIDKYTVELLRTWLTAEDGTHLIPMVQRARKACKMKYLVGSAPVVYGLPVFLKRGKQI